MPPHGRRSGSPGSRISMDDGAWSEIWESRLPDLEGRRPMVGDLGARAPGSRWMTAHGPRSGSPGSRISKDSAPWLEIWEARLPDLEGCRPMVGDLGAQAPGSRGMPPH